MQSRKIFLDKFQRRIEEKISKKITEIVNRRFALCRMQVRNKTKGIEIKNK